MNKLLIGLGILIVAGCATSTPRPARILSCSNPRGIEYVCYSDRECSEYMSGYSAVFGMKAAKPEDSNGWGQAEEHPVVYMNLYNATTKLRLVGKMEGEMRDGKMYMKMWTIVCNPEGEILSEDYSEGFRKEKPHVYEEEVDPES